MTTLSTPSTRPGSGDAPPPQRPIARPALLRVGLALVRKETRELALPLGLIVLVYGAVLALALRDMASYSAPQYANTPSVLNSTITQVGIIVAALAGLLLGFFQFFGESRPDRFGFLTHRPVSRSLIFWGKTLPGLALYFVALALPLLVALLWASNPRHIPLPFSWRMALAPLADILSGIPYYFAGVLVARRTDARWIGSRLLPAAAPVIASLLDLVSANLGWALLWIALATLITATAAHGFFTAGGEYPRLRFPARAAAGVILLAALLTSGLAGVGLLEDMTMSRERDYSGTSKHPLILTDGSVVVVTTEYSSNKLVNYRIEDLSGKVLSENRAIINTEKGPYASMQFCGGNAYDYHSTFHDPASYFDSTFLDFGNADWYRAKDILGGDYLVGFDGMNHRRLGAIGAQGFQPGVAVPAARFAKPLHTARVFMAQLNGGSYSYPMQSIPLEQRSLLAAGDTIYRVLDTGKLETFFTIPDHQPIVQFFGGEINDPSRTEHPLVDSYVVAVTDGAVRILSYKADVLVNYERPGVGRQLVYTAHIQEQAGAEGRYMLVIPTVRKSAYEDTKPEELVYFKPDGSLDHKMELPQFENYTPNRLDFVEAYIGVPLAPPVGTGISVLADAVNNPHFAREAAYWRQIILSMAATAVVSAAAAFFLARRKRMRLAVVWLWTVIAFLAGPAGLLLLLCLRGLPLTTPCAQCRRPRPLNADLCPNCGMAPAAPARKGTEIFA